MRLCLIALLTCLLAFGAQAQQLDQSLSARIGGFPGAVTLYAKNLDTGVAIGIRESDPVRTASTIKLAIMASVFDAVARKQGTWTERLTVTSREKVNGTGIIASELSDGVQLPVSDVLHLMMVLSDNTATNMIIERFTTDRVNTYLDTIGMKSTRSLRKILGGPGQDPGTSAAGKSLPIRNTDWASLRRGTWLRCLKSCIAGNWSARKRHSRCWQS